MATTTQQYHGVGRRKTSVARVYLRPGRGDWVINGRPLSDVKVVVRGGGKTGQAGAIRLGLARALLKLDPDHRGVLRTRGMLTRDPREVERKKPGRPKARKRFQFSKR